MKAIWEHPWSLESNHARGARNEVALLASLGWISTIAPDGLSYTRAWRVTAEGHFALREHANGGV